MAFILKNQKPQLFYKTTPNLPLINIGESEDDYAQKLKAHAFDLYVRQLYTPINKKNNVVIQDDVSGSTLDPRQFTEGLLQFLKTDVLDSDLTKDLLNLYDQGSIHSLKSQLSFDQFPVMEAISESGLPYPEAGRVIYTPGELTNSANNLFNEMNTVSPANIRELREKWFAHLGGYISQFHISNFRLITVKNAQTFDDLKTRMKNYMKQSITLATDTDKHLSQFDNLSLDDELSIGLFLPHELDDEVNGFNRIMEHEMAKMERERNPRLFSEPFSLKGTLRPSKLIIINLEEYSHGKNLQREWQQIVRAFNSTHKIQHIKNKNLQTVAGVDREVTSPGDYNGGDQGVGDAALRSNRVNFTNKDQMSRQELVKRIKSIARKQSANQITSNQKKQIKNTFMRNNRRKPDDINAQGKITSTIYSPDLHVWQDTSGSISSSDYEKEVYTIIAIAKHLNVDIYFNSFSHHISETTKVSTKNRKPKAIFELIEQIQKVAGGTNFVNVWEGIDATEAALKRSNNAERIHLIISDMDYNIPSSYTLLANRPSVRNTYYIPIRIGSSGDRRNIQSFAKDLESRGGKGLATGHILF